MSLHRIELIVTAPDSALIAGCGYVGQRVAAVWQQNGMQVHAITRSAAKAQDLSKAGITPIHLDLADAAKPIQLPDVDVVLWCVGFDRSTGTSRQAIWIDGLQRLLNALHRRAEPRRILYTSSTSVYGDGHGQDVDETTKPSPTSEGGKACLAAEQLLRTYSMQNSASVSILRLAGIYGPNRLLRRIADLQNGTPIMSPPDEWLNLIHVDDAVRAIDCICRLESPPPLINIVAGESSTRRQYYSQLAIMANAGPPTFATEPELQTRLRGGNRRVISVLRDSIPIAFKYDTITEGLRHAFS